MKWMVASDIHGSAFFAEKMLEAFRAEEADRLLLLGDILYHGPRNDLPEGYEPKKVIAMLNAVSDKIVCVRGNCDAHIDETVLDFPFAPVFTLIDSESRMIFATHGHFYGEENPPSKDFSEILLCGHTHVPAIRDRDSFVYMNPGSISIPKENSPHSYMTIEEDTFTIKDLDGTPFKCVSVI